MTKEAVKRIAEDYLYYLKIGAFRNIPVEKDIEVCSDFIEVLEKPFLQLHINSQKNAYIKKASHFKNIVSGQGGLEEVIRCCDKVMENPNYNNCVALDDVLEMIFPDESYDGVIAENKQQEFIHRKLWRYINKTLKLLA
ncbi:MAG: hypothetical protein IK057_00690 [Clostridia bacterium]|nr:hypothetical protein [Clostridia bacterium]